MHPRASTWAWRSASTCPFRASRSSERLGANSQPPEPSVPRVPGAPEVSTSLLSTPASGAPLASSSLSFLEVPWPLGEPLPAAPLPGPFFRMLPRPLERSFCCALSLLTAAQTGSRRACTSPRVGTAFGSKGLVLPSGVVLPSSAPVGLGVAPGVRPAPSLPLWARGAWPLPPPFWPFGGCGLLAFFGSGKWGFSGSSPSSAPSPPSPPPCSPGLTTPCPGTKTCSFAASRASFGRWKEKPLGPPRPWKTYTGVSSFTSGSALWSALDPVTLSTCAAGR
mmetsp:Transcript_45184/g.80821  ORF Transcript_45184/g.80821 Transcript_45184/m.80821 type:complete len:279 (+) Transcript_45184:453-1289(+)